jgi:hypothetical protein
MTVKLAGTPAERGWNDPRDTAANRSCNYLHSNLYKHRKIKFKIYLRDDDCVIHS